MLKHEIRYSTLTPDYSFRTTPARTISEQTYNILTTLITRNPSYAHPGLYRFEQPAQFDRFERNPSFHLTGNYFIVYDKK